MSDILRDRNEIIDSFKSRLNELAESSEGCIKVEVNEFGIEGIDIFDIVMDVKCAYSWESNSGKPSFNDLYKFNLIVPEKFPVETQILLIQENGRNRMPFHPHFNVLGKSDVKSPYIETTIKKAVKEEPEKVGIWIEYKENSLEPEGLDVFLERVFASLKYHPEAINISSTAANTEALRIYNKYKSREDIFPYRSEWEKPLSKSKESEVSEPENQPNKFNIQNTGSPSNSINISGAVSKKFVITKEADIYKPAEKEKGKFIINKNLSSNSSYDLDQNYELYITENAKKKIWDHIDFGHGRPTQKNSVEQGGLLLGQVYKDPADTSCYGHVEDVVCGDNAQGTSTYLEMGHEVWKSMMDKFDELVERSPNKPLQVIGWYHTHPNHLDVFMSGTDMGTQRSMFKEDWQFAIVINPTRRIWRVFHGVDAKECNGYYLETEEVHELGETNDGNAGEDELNQEEGIEQQSALKKFVGRIQNFITQRFTPEPENANSEDSST